MQNVHANITGSILAQLKQGVAPWRQTWQNGTEFDLPHNAISGRNYSGSNLFILWLMQNMHGYKSSAWLTYKQAKEAGGSVRKGERSTVVIYMSHVPAKNVGKADEKPGYWVMRTYLVFNVDQCENLKIKPREKRKPIASDVRNEDCDNLIGSLNLILATGSPKYARKTDVIYMPEFSMFSSASEYYATFFHEIIHWTGAPDRLNRTKGKRFGDAEYSYEELVAELGAAILCAEMGVVLNIENTAAYIGSWIKFLSDHETAFVNAAADASKAVEYIRGRMLAETEEDHAQAA